MLLRFLPPLFAAAAIVALGGPGARAAQFVVVKAEGLRLAPGTPVDGSKPLSLEDGQELTLLTASGRVLTFDGPSTVTPDSGLTSADGGDLKTAMAALITERKVRTSEVGIVRGDHDVKLPDPWVVDVTHPGISCVEPGKPVVLWRSGDLTAAPVVFSPKDQSWHVSGTWPAAADRLALPASMPLRDFTDYVVDVDRRLAPVKVRLIPRAVNNDAMRVGYMIGVGCDDQANAILATWQKK
jgi:hypothetical protein